MKHAMLTLDYFALSKEAKALKMSSAAKVIRIALLADCATQHLATIMRAIAARNNVLAEVYEGNYDGVDLEILDPNSALYAFNPQYVVVLLSSEKLKARLYASGDRRTFADETVGRLESFWTAFRAHSQATIVQSTFVLPSERAFGNYELKVADSVGSIFTEINYRLALKAREAKNVLLNDIDFLAASVGRAQWLDARMWNMAKTPCRLEHVPLLAQSLLDTIFAASGLITKCVVLDLDNTLWGGVIGDDGLEGIALGEFDEGEAFVGFQKFIRELKRRGIILAVVSKNEHANAVLPFREHPHMALKEEDISVFVANWDNKADNIRLIQKTLNIGFDSLVFLDDNPFERNIVREFLPEVVVPELPEDPSLYLQTLADLNLFETASFSEADLQRADQYREEAQRELTKTHFTNINDYLTSLAMEIRLERFNAFNLPRIAQLIQRSNQFNLMTRRYGEAACEAMMKDPSRRAAHAEACRQIRRLRPDFGRHSQACRRGARNRRISDELPRAAARRRKLRHEQHLRLRRAAGREAGRRPLHSDGEERHGEGLFQGFGFEKVADGDGGASQWALAVDAYRPRETFMTPVVNEL